MHLPTRRVVVGLLTAALAAGAIALVPRADAESAGSARRVRGGPRRAPSPPAT